MSDQPAKPTKPIAPFKATAGGDATVNFLAELVAEGVAVDGDAVLLDPNVWAIHGAIAYDGETILAEFDTLEQARQVLDRVNDSTHRTPDP